MGLPLAVQFTGHGWDVTAVDVQASVVDSINAGRNHVTEEPGLTEGVAAAHAAGRLRATLDGAAAAATADVVVLIVPVMLDDEQQPDYRYMDAAVEAIAPGVHAGSTIIFETTLPVGDTRHRFAPRLEAVSGLRADAGLLRGLLARAAVQRLGPQEPGDVPQARRRSGPRVGRPGGRLLRLGPRRGGRPDELGRGRRVQQAGRHDLSRREHRPGQRVRPLRRPGRRGCPGGDRGGQQPAVQPHPPARASGVGGHCIPVYPHFLLSRAPGDGAGRAEPAGQRRPDRAGDPDDPEGARRPRRASRSSSWA